METIPASWLHVVWWAGLRGAVSTALALSLPNDFPHRSDLQGIVFGVVLFTLIVQATTAEWVVGRWGKTAPAQEQSEAGNAEAAWDAEAGDAEAAEA